MNCDRHVLNVHWTHHHWVRQVSTTHDAISRDTDMWGRPVENEQVTCHITHVCETCGSTFDGGECGCDKSRAEHCARRLAYLDAQR